MEGKTNSRENNFNIIRFMAAIMVMAGHMAYIGGYSLPILWGQGIQSLGVKIFFLIGGYLISKSWLSDPNPLRYSGPFFLVREVYIFCPYRYNAVSAALLFRLHRARHSEQSGS